MASDARARVSVSASVVDGLLGGVGVNCLPQSSPRARRVTTWGRRQLSRSVTAWGRPHLTRDRDVWTKHRRVNYSNLLTLHVSGELA